MRFLYVFGAFIVHNQFSRADKTLTDDSSVYGEIYQGYLYSRT